LANPKKRREREKQVRKKLARKRHADSREEARVPATPPPTPDRFAVTYKDPNDLAAIGPIVKAAGRWGLDYRPGGG
jgi:hypothetical protein